MNRLLLIIGAWLACVLPATAANPSFQVFFGTNGIVIRTNGNVVQVDGGMITNGASAVFITTNLFVVNNTYTSNLFATNIFVDQFYVSNIYTTNIFVDQSITTSNFFSTNITVENISITTNLVTQQIITTNIFVISRWWLATCMSQTFSPTPSSARTSCGPTTTDGAAD